MTYRIGIRVGRSFSYKAAFFSMLLFAESNHSFYVAVRREKGTRPARFVTKVLDLSELEDSTSSVGLPARITSGYFGFNRSPRHGFRSWNCESSIRKWPRAVVFLDSGWNESVR